MSPGVIGGGAFWCRCGIALAGVCGWLALQRQAGLDLQGELGRRLAALESRFPPCQVSPDLLVSGSSIGRILSQVKGKNYIVNQL